MKVVFRVDSSNKIGGGHLYRSLVLAEELKSHEMDICFICKVLPGSMDELVTERGFNLIKIRPAPKADYVYKNEYESWLGEPLRSEIEIIHHTLSQLGKIDLIVVDHYALNYKWHKEIRHLTKKIMVIDDLANRIHDCDILLDHGYVHNFESRYDGIIPNGCLKYLGPRHALLAKDLTRVKKKREEKILSGKKNKVLVYFGSADDRQLTIKCLKVLVGLDYELTYDVVVGSANLRKEEIRKICSQQRNISFYQSPDCYYDLIQNSDICIGAGGVSVLERIYVNLPSILLCGAENQKEILKKASEMNMFMYLDKPGEIGKGLDMYLRGKWPGSHVKENPAYIFNGEGIRELLA
jgi:UDP-2,4-diacetamido-2,4,6-trideoxy-beta-L-altropyranose hydrolase